jgi:hypothetical protein
MASGACTGGADAVTQLQRFGLFGADVNYDHGNMPTDEKFDLIAGSSGTLSISFPVSAAPGTRNCLGFGVDAICSAGTDLFSEMRLALAAERSRANAAALAGGERVPTVDLYQRDMLRLAHSRRRASLEPRRRDRQPHPRQAGRHRRHRHALTPPRRIRRPGGGHGARRRPRPT